MPAAALIALLTLAATTARAAPAAPATRPSSPVLVAQRDARVVTAPSSLPVLVAQRHAHPVANPPSSPGLIAQRDARVVTAPSSSPVLVAQRDARPDTARSSSEMLDALGGDDRGAIERAVAAIGALPAGGVDPDVLLAAARACEDKLLDPARAAAIYERLLAEHPMARAAAAAARRVAAIRAQIGARGEAAAQAAELAQLIAQADDLPAEIVVERGERLVAAAWPGAPTAALWLADWSRRAGRYDDAQARYAALVTRWPALPQAGQAERGAVRCALDAGDWSLAERLAQRLPAVDPADQDLRDQLLAAAAHGRRRDHWYAAAWLALAGALAALVGSLVEAARRGPPGTRWSALRPPVEAMYLAPVTAVLIGVAFTAHRLIAPAVATIAIGGLVLAWLSGATLERLRSLGLPRRVRGAAHVVACLAAVAALAYIALTRDHLLDLLIDTVRFGPEP